MTLVADFRRFRLIILTIACSMRRRTPGQAGTPASKARTWVIAVIESHRLGYANAVIWSNKNHQSRAKVREVQVILIIYKLHQVFRISRGGMSSAQLAAGTSSKGGRCGRVRKCSQYPLLWNEPLEGSQGTSSRICVETVTACELSSSIKPKVRILAGYMSWVR